MSTELLVINYVGVTGRVWTALVFKVQDLGYLNGLGVCGWSGSDRISSLEPSGMSFIGPRQFKFKFLTVCSFCLKGRLGICI